MQKIIILIILIFTSAFSFAAPTKISWVHYANMPAKRSNIVLFKRNHLIYVLGGNDEQGATKTFWSFDLKNKKWTVLSPMNEARFGHAATLYHDELYVFGGMNGSNHYLDSIEKYNFTKNRWEIIGKMPLADVRFALAQFQGKIYLIGGVNSENTALNNVEVYNPDHHAWTSKTPLIIPRNRMSAIVYQNHLYLLGGADDKNQALNDLLQYDAKTDRWITISHLNEARENYAFAIDHHQLFVAGGWRQENQKTIFVDSTELYNPENNTWRVVGNLPEGKDGVRMIDSPDGILLFGGYRDGPTDEILIRQIDSQSLPDEITTVNHVCLVVSDMKKTLKFYHDLLGFSIVHDRTEGDTTISKELGLKNIHLRNVMVETPNHFRLEFLQIYQPKTIFKNHKMNQVGYNHMGVGVKDINAAYRILKKNHIQTISKPMIKKSTGYAIFFALDPDGNYVEFFQSLNTPQ